MARLPRAEIAVLLDRLIDFIEDDDNDISEMLPEYAYNLGVVRARLEAIQDALCG